jgi:hypothetical protein
VDCVDPISNLRDVRDSIDNSDAAIIHMLADGSGALAQH